MILPGKIRKNFELNRRADTSPAADRRGLLNGQGRPELSRLRFGYADVGRAGCESIAVYNALRLLGRPRALAEIIRDMEKGGYLRLGGHLGAAPWFEPLLRRYGVTGKLALPSRLRRESRSDEGVYIMVIWNRRWQPQRGMHTFAAARTAAGWEVFNRFNSDTASRFYFRLDDIVRNGAHTGAFFVIYRVEEYK